MVRKLLNSRNLMILLILFLSTCQVRASIMPTDEVSTSTKKDDDESAKIDTKNDDDDSVEIDTKNVNYYYDDDSVEIEIDMKNDSSEVNTEFFIIHVSEECEKEFGQYSCKEFAKGIFQLYKCIHRKTGKEVVIKEIPTEILNKTNEVESLKTLKGNENIIEFEEVFELGLFSYIVTEFVDGGDLLDLMHVRSPVDKETIQKYFRQIVDAVSFMHKNDIIHRDLKPENIVVTNKKYYQNATLKIIDFGHSIDTENPEGKDYSELWGTDGYKAPEKEYSEKSDVWSMGVILYQLFTGKDPIDTKEGKLQRKYLETLWEIIESPKIIHLFRAMLQENPKNRISLNDILNHEFYRQDEIEFFNDIYKETSETIQLSKREINEDEDDISRLYTGIKLNYESDALHESFQLEAKIDFEDDRKVIEVLYTNNIFEHEKQFFHGTVDEAKKSTICPYGYSLCNANQVFGCVKTKDIYNVTTNDFPKNEGLSEMTCYSTNRAMSYDLYKILGLNPKFQTLEEIYDINAQKMITNEDNENNSTICALMGSTHRTKQYDLKVRYFTSNYSKKELERNLSTFHYVVNTKEDYINYVYFKCEEKNKLNTFLRDQKIRSSIDSMEEKDRKMHGKLEVEDVAEVVREAIIDFKNLFDYTESIMPIIQDKDKAIEIEQRRKSARNKAEDIIKITRKDVDSFKTTKDFRDYYLILLEFNEKIRQFVNEDIDFTMMLFKLDYKEASETKFSSKIIRRKLGRKYLNYFGTFKEDYKNLLNPTKENTGTLNRRCSSIDTTTVDGIKYAQNLLQNIPGSSYWYNEQDIIAAGRYSVVFKGYMANKECEKLEDVAIKKIYEVDRKKIDRSANEKNNLEKFTDCNCIVQFKQLFQTDETYDYIVTELLEGETLAELMKRSGFFDEEAAKKYFKPIVQTINYMHFNDVIHQDLNPDNIMVIKNNDGKDVIKIIDFGSSFHLQSLTSNIQDGKKLYMPPETNKSGRGLTKRDVWALGVILYELLVGSPPPVTDTGIVDISKINWDKVKITKSAQDLMEKMLCDLDVRIDSNQILQHEWFSGIKSNTCSCIIL